MKKIGFIGLGNMGLPMACNLVAGSQREVVVFDVRAEAVAAAVSVGATAADSVSSLATVCDVIYVSLPTPILVERVLLEEGGLLGSAQQGMVIVDLSTNSPTVAKRVAAQLAEAGVIYLESPVTGGVVKAKDGTLTIMVGGDESTYQEHRRLYASIAKQTHHVGPVGSASTVKLVNNMMLLCNLAAAAEGVALAAKAGLDLEKFAEVVSNGSGFSSGFRMIAARAFNNDFSPAFALDLAHKDFSLAMGMEEELGVPSMMTAPALAMMRIAKNAGYGALDSTSLLKVFESFTGVEARIAQRQS